MEDKLTGTRPHYEILDGLRGVAAIAVVIFHFMEMAITDYTQNFIAHGFLAVDFFFCLSGFVIAYAYDDRIRNIGLAAFFRARLIRLHPLVILGSILGLLAFLFDPFGGSLAGYSSGRIILLFIASILLIPFPVMAERANNLFGLNAPAWSLFWEYIANIVYALVLHRLSKWALLVLAFFGAVLLVYTSNHAGGSLMGGWGKPNFWDGGARVFYSFLAGMLVYRFNGIIHSRLGFIGVAILLALTFVMPFNQWNWLTEPLVVIFYFPLIVALGAGAKLAKSLRPLCVMAGRLSYPLYMTHYAVIWSFLNYYNAYKPTMGQLAVIICVGVVILISFAYLVMRIYDTPVRAYLSNKRKG
ncbi:MAG: acyltransferase [Pedobacter sp.]|nr:acyltransferase [Pedobacter sp.]